MANQPTFGVAIPQQHRSWSTLVELWREVEALGFDTVWCWDHFVPLSGSNDGDSLEAWSLLAGIAVQTSQIRFGTLVTSTTYRHPSVLAKQAATIDHMSGGRLILGIGAGWMQREHHAYGIPFPSARERVDRFEESIAIFDALFRQDHPSFKGKYYSLNRAPFSPRQIQQPRIPILVGSTGTRMLRSVARYADMWHAFGGPQHIAERGGLLNRYCQEIGRDPAEIRWSVSLGDSQLESADRFRRAVEAYAAVGASDFLLEILEGRPCEQLRRLAESVIPEIRANWPAGSE